MAESFDQTGLRVDSVQKRVGNAFTLEASFSLRSGERAAIVGRSGSGKTSLLRIIAGLSAPDAGEIFLGGRNLTPLPPEKRDIGVIFQDQALFPGLSVLENAAFGLRMRGVKRETREVEALPWLERVGLKTHAHSGVDRLSGGERQRVAFVRALIWKPRLLLLDEPFSALDAELRGVLRRELVDLHGLWPVPLLMVTHDEADLDVVATVRIGVREEGGVRRFGRA